LHQNRCRGSLAIADVGQGVVKKRSQDAEIPIGGQERISHGSTPKGHGKADIVFSTAGFDPTVADSLDFGKHRNVLLIASC
jgi:hypothetical protein